MKNSKENIEYRFGWVIIISLFLLSGLANNREDKNTNSSAHNCSVEYISQTDNSAIVPASLAVPDYSIVLSTCDVIPSSNLSNNFFSSLKSGLELKVCFDTYSSIKPLLSNSITYLHLFSLSDKDTPPIS